jgi:hypothetical protein
MADLGTLQGIAGKIIASGTPVTAFTDDVAHVVPNGIGFYAGHVVSDGAPVACTVPAAADTKAGVVLLNCPNGAANNVTITPRAGTINGGGNLVVSAANIVLLIAIAGLTDWKALVVA